jgi:hypothetical protein
MKKRILPLTAFLLFASVISFQPLGAQDKTKSDQEKEQKIQREIEQQKKAINDQKKMKAEAESKDDQAKAMGEAADSLREQAEDLEENLKDMQNDIESSRDDGDVKIFSRRGRHGFDYANGFVMPPMPDFFFNGGGGNTERTTWEFSKVVKENTFTEDYNFDVEKTVNTVVMSIMGDCKKGEIRINIVMPGGKNYSDIVIDEFGNLNWRKSFTISETENQDKAGEWKFKIASKGATGYFKISLHTY